MVLCVTIQIAPSAPSPWLKRQLRGAAHSPPTSAEVENCVFAEWYLGMDKFRNMKIRWIKPVDDIPDVVDGTVDKHGHVQDMQHKIYQEE
jgi:hypothetical protein